MLATIIVEEILAHLHDDRHVGKPGAATFLGVSVRWVETYLHELPHFRLPSGHVRFRISELCRWMDQHRIGDPTDVEEIVDDVVSKIIQEAQ